MKYLLYLVILFSNLNIHAQSSVQKSFSAGDISTIRINGNSVFKMSIETSKTESISILSRVEGENNEQVVLISETKNNTLYISTNYQPLFADANDKLSAHKVISIELVLSIPEGKSIYLSSDIGSIIVKGHYYDVTIELINGDCILKDFDGRANVNTIQGDITVFTKFASVDAFTKNGILSAESLSVGNSILTLYSINGNITVSKSQ